MIQSLISLSRTSKRPAFGAIFLLNNISFLRTQLLVERSEVTAILSRPSQDLLNSNFRIAKAGYFDANFSPLLQTLIDDPEVDVDMPQEAEEEDDMLDAFIALPDASSQEPRSTSRMLGPTSTSVSLGNKRKASEESDEAPEKKKAASTAPLIPSSLRHSESYDP